MPGFDKTGPMGQGPLTGRQMGNCADARAGFGGGAGRGFGRGLGRGYGRGFGRAAGFSGGYSPEASSQADQSLIARIEQLEQELASLRRSSSQQ